MPANPHEPSPPKSRRPQSLTINSLWNDDSVLLFTPGRLLLGAAVSAIAYGFYLLSSV